MTTKEFREDLKIVIKTRLLEFAGIFSAFGVFLFGLFVLARFYTHLTETYFFFMFAVILFADFLVLRHCVKKYGLFTEEYKEKNDLGYYVLRIQYFVVSVGPIILTILGIIWFFMKGIGVRY